MTRTSLSLQNLKSNIIKHKKGLATMLLTFLLLYILTDYFTILVSPTPSLKHKVFFVIKSPKNINTDYSQIVVIKRNDSKKIQENKGRGEEIGKEDKETEKDILVIKQIIGKEGDLINARKSRDSNDIEAEAEVSINNPIIIMRGKKDTKDPIFAIIGKCKERDTKGNKLTCIKPQIIPKDHYFVFGDTEDSFDSRYEEFGLIKEQDILYNAYPLF